MMSKFLQTYLKFWAKKYLARACPKIVGVTGSVGKTSVKDAIFEVLSMKFGQDVRKSVGNLNNQTGLPLAILGFSHAPSYSESFLGWLPIIFLAPWCSLSLKPVKILVLEFASDKPGDIKYLTSIVQPDVAVLTAIAPAHLEAFGAIDKIVEEKTELLRSLTKNGWAVLNQDSEQVKKASYGGWWHKYTYAITSSADIQATSIKSKIANFKPLTNYNVVLENETLEIVQNTLGNAFVSAGLAAIAVAKILEIDNKDIVEGLANYHLDQHRMNVLEGKKETIILDDCYNANPVSMAAALEVLKNLPKGQGRKIAVLGDMREIGEISDSAHREIGVTAKKITDLTVGIGKLAKKYNADKYFISPEKAGDFLLAEIKKNDIILLKASRGAGLQPMLVDLVERLKK